MITIRINTENAAFDDKDYEVARILRYLAESIANGNMREKLTDVNGNVVGTAKEKK